MEMETLPLMMVLQEIDLQVILQVGLQAIPVMVQINSRP